MNNDLRMILDNFDGEMSVKAVIGSDSRQLLDAEKVLYHWYSIVSAELRRRDEQRKRLEQA